MWAQARYNPIRFGPLAQLAEQLTFNQLVVGSNPTRLTQSSALGTKPEAIYLIVKVQHKAITLLGRQSLRVIAFFIACYMRLHKSNKSTKNEAQMQIFIISRVRHLFPLCHDRTDVHRIRHYFS